MSHRSISGLVNVGLDILTTVVSETAKRIFVQTGDVVSETVDSDEVEWWQHVGFASRPPKADAGKEAAQGVVMKTSDRDVCFASVDNRGLELYGNLDHGETSLYAAGEDGKGQARVLLKKDGSIALYTRKGNSPTGTGMVVQVDAMNGAIRLVNDKGYGLIIDDSGVTLTAGEAALTLGGDGTAKLIATGMCQVDGSSICLGSKAVSGVNSVLVGVTGLVGTASTKVFADMA